MMSCHSALQLYLCCNQLRFPVTVALLGLSSVRFAHGDFSSLVNMSFLSGGKVQRQCTLAVAESFVFMLAAPLFVSRSLL